MDDADDSAHLLGYGDPTHKQSTLQEITAQRTLDVEVAKAERSAEELRKAADSLIAELGPPQSLLQRITVAEASPWKLALCAEFKRASPSKGDINVGLDIGEQALIYAKVGATVISTLTEPKWFKGSLQDLLRARRQTQSWAKDQGVARPLLLRKDFLVDEYQVLEALAHGADTVLLMISVLPVSRLRSLLAFCRAQGMEPLVEVASSRELEIAVRVGAAVIGVNNRDLHTLQLDAQRTSRLGTELREQLGVRFGPGEGVKLLALSGLASASDVAGCREVPCSGVLVGEALMRAADPDAAVREMMGETGDEAVLPVPPGKELVKVCGVTQDSDARAAVEAGANLIGIILAKSKRTPTPEQQGAVVAAVRRFGERTAVVAAPPEAPAASPAERLLTRAAAFQKACSRKPLVVGVFMNQTESEVVEAVQVAGVDVVQLHGNEDAALVEALKKRLPTAWFLKVLHMPPKALEGQEAAGGGLAALRDKINEFSPVCDALLLDTALAGSTSGGTGAKFDWDAVKVVQEEWTVPVFVAGGITADTVAGLVSATRPFGVDVSSGIEDSVPGVKNVEKTVAYVRNAKRARLA